MSSRLELNKLFALGKITEKEYNEKIQGKNKILNEKNKYTDNPNVGIKHRINETKCDKCGDALNGGTYGIIFNHSENPKKVIKGSILGHSITHECPESFLHEIEMYDRIKNAFPKKLQYIKMLGIYDNWTENRRCYYVMDKLEPIKLSQTQKEKIDDYLIHSRAPLIDYVLNEMKTNPKILMLVPGVIPTQGELEYTKIEGGIGTSEWREINLPIMKIVFSILDMNIEMYKKELNKVINNMYENNIIRDVEFILAFTENQGIGIYMVDFDKTIDYLKHQTEPFDKAKRQLLTEDMFFK